MFHHLYSWDREHKGCEEIRCGGRFRVEGRRKKEGGRGGGGGGEREMIYLERGMRAQVRRKGGEGKKRRRR